MSRSGRRRRSLGILGRRRLGSGRGRQRGRARRRRGLRGRARRGGRGLDNIADVLALAARDAGRRAVRVDLSLARGLSYYTGAIMEIAVPDLAGSLGGGGRYDNLVGMFLGEQVPACGFSLGLERILVVMGERGMFPAAHRRRGRRRLVAQWNDATPADALALARELRARRASASRSIPEADKLGQAVQVRRLDGVPLVVVGATTSAPRQSDGQGPAHGRAATIPRATARRLRSRS